MKRYKVQDLGSLEREMRAVARGERPAPADAAKPSFNSVTAVLRLLTPGNRQLLALIRDRVAADACCPHCGRRPIAAHAQASALIDDIARLPRHRPGRQRTSPRTAAERRDGHTENVSYTITIEKSNLPEWDITSNI